MTDLAGFKSETKQFLKRCLIIAIALAAIGLAILLNEIFVK